MEHRLLVCDNSSVEQIAPICENRCIGIEVQAFYQPDVLEDAGQIDHHRRCIANIRERSLHGPFGDLCPGSFDPMVREVARHRFEQACDVAHELAATDIVLHHGYVPGTSSRDGWLYRSEQFWKSFLKRKPVDLMFHLENMLELEANLLVDVVDAIGLPNLDIALDIGHAHCNSQTPVLEWIVAAGRRIGYVHLHDNHGEKDEHLGLGRGTIPILEIAHALRELAPGAKWAVEAEGEGVLQSLEWLEKHGFL